MLTEKEFCAYAEKYIDTVYRVAFSMLKNPHDADDVTQDTFLKLYTSSGKCEEVNATVVIDKEGGTYGGYEALMPYAAIKDVK